VGRDLKYSIISVSLILVVLLSLVIATPVYGSWISGPWEVDAVQGDVFLLRYHLVFYPTAPSGYFSSSFEEWYLEIYWYHGGNRTENFTLENFPIVYYDNGDPVENVTIDNYAGSNRCYVTLFGEVYVPDDEVYFFVDVWLRAASDGIPHRPMRNHPIYFYGSWVTLRDYTEVNVEPWNEGVVVEGKGDAYNVNGTGIGPITWYGTGDRPPILVARRGDDNENKGAVVAAGTAAACRDGNWNDPSNPNPHLDNLLDAAFQWMKPGAENVIWYEGYGVYNDSNRCSQLTSALQGRGYNIVADNFEPITVAMLGDNDILVIPQLQLGSSSVGGDSTLLPDADLEAIKTWVEDNHGLLIMESGDNDNNFCLVQNKILKMFDFDWWFQHDQVNDTINNWGTNYRPIADVDITTAIGGGYHSALQSSSDTIGLHNVCSLALHKAGFKLENLYKVSLDVALYLENGSKLVVKFFTYGGDNQGENVIWAGSTPTPVAFLENVPQPRGSEEFPRGSVQIARLVLTTDNENEVISTMASFTVHQSDLRARIMAILRIWEDQPEQQSAFRAEFVEILRQWSSAPA